MKEIGEQLTTSEKTKLPPKSRSYEPIRPLDVIEHEVFQNKPVSFFEKSKLTRFILKKLDEDDNLPPKNPKELRAMEEKEWSLHQKEQIINSDYQKKIRAEMVQADKDAGIVYKNPEELKEMEAKGEELTSWEQERLKNKKNYEARKNKNKNK